MLYLKLPPSLLRLHVQCVEKRLTVFICPYMHVKPQYSWPSRACYRRISATFDAPPRNFILIKFHIHAFRFALNLFCFSRLRDICDKAIHFSIFNGTGIHVRPSFNLFDFGLWNLKKYCLGGYVAKLLSPSRYNVKNQSDYVCSFLFWTIGPRVLISQECKPRISEIQYRRETAMEFAKDFGKEFWSSHLAYAVKVTRLVFFWHERRLLQLNRLCIQRLIEKFY